MSKTAFLFSGQGAQAPGMMRDEYESTPASRRVFEVADEVLGRSISGLCFEGTQEELNFTHNTQPCVLAADLAAYEAVLASGLQPDGFAGFSLGEYAALVAAGCLDMADAFRLVQLRADAMQEAVPVGEGAMAAIMKIALEEVQVLCDEVGGYVVPANINSSDQIVVSGEVAAVDELLGLCRERKVRSMKLPVSAPFHCELMASAADALKEALETVNIREPRLPIYMNVDAHLSADPADIKAKMVAQAKSPVLWMQTLRAMWDDGYDAFVECGPGKTLTGFVKKTLPDAERL